VKKTSRFHLINTRTCLPMVKSILIFVLMSLLAFDTVKAKQSGFGIGVIIGEPTGLSAKLWTENSAAFDAAIAWSLEDERYMHLQGDFLFHRSNIAGIKKGKLLPYYGIGGRVQFGEKNTVGVRIPFGINYVFERSHFDVFLEFVPLLDIVRASEFDLDGAIGIRYFFGKDTPK